MNERLKELMIESGAFDYYEINEGVEDDEKPMVKLAELIVKKCIDTLEFHGFDDAVPYIKWMTINHLGIKE